MSRGIKLSNLSNTLALDITPFLGKLQQLGLVKIVFDPSIGKEPHVQLTEKGREQLNQLLLSG